MDVKKEVAGSKIAGSSDIAIVGISCRFPDSNNYEEFWDNIIMNRSSIIEIPPERWNWKEFWGNQYEGGNKSDVKWGSFIKDVDKFDADFFEISFQEADSMDPQQRIMLELAWECFEDAGIRPSSVSGESVGVYIGAFNHDYKELYEKGTHVLDSYYVIGTALTALTNRISYFFNLKGPSIPIDTACSSSLYAVHLAVQAINNGECKIALAGGISLLLTPSRLISFSKTGVLSPTGECRSFDDDADGYVRGEGAGILILKKLEDAQKDDDHIYGIIKGTAINHNGKGKKITYPNPEAQAEVIKQALKKAELTTDKINYIEAQGTGTPKGDLLEIKGFVKAFQNENAQHQEHLKNYCGIGTVKTNIGHTESAAGVAAIIKVLMALKYRQLPGLQNFKRINQNISLDNTPFYLVDALKEWLPVMKNSQYLPRRAGISNFGFGGTNAHVVLEEAPEKEKVVHRKYPYYLICLSAKTNQALMRNIRQIQTWLKTKGKSKDILDISANLINNRDHQSHRAAFIVKNIYELIQLLNNVLMSVEEREAFFHGEEKETDNSKLELGKKILKDFYEDKIKDQDEYYKGLELLAKLYVSGNELCWNLLFSDNNPARINLPTYSFEKNCFWFTNSTTEDSSNVFYMALKNRPIHPFIHRNVSDFSRQKFSTIFNGSERFITGHLVDGIQILPEMIYLEMVRVAAAVSSGYKINSKVQMKFHQIKWFLNAKIQSDNTELYTTLVPLENGQIQFGIYKESVLEKMKENWCCTGRAEIFTEEYAKKIDIDIKKRDCKQKALSSKDLYGLLEKAKIVYGVTNRTIEELFVKENRAVAKLRVDTSLVDEMDDFMLHPAILNAGVHAANGLFLLEEQKKNKNPYGIQACSLKEMQVYKSCCEVMWVYVKWNKEDEEPGSTKKFDLIFCDESGSICVQLKSLLFKNCADASIESASANKMISDDLLKKKGIEFIKNIVSQVTHVSAKEIDPNQYLENYGIDSLLITRLTGTLKKHFANVNATMFFECQTIDELTEYFIEKYREEMIDQIGKENLFDAKENRREDRILSDLLNSSNFRYHMPQKKMKDENTSKRTEGIAIIGISGQYPQADNLDQLWSNLKEGRNCITEIPEARWDWKQYYDEQKGKKGRIYTKWGGFLEDIDKFDPLFFNISPIEAEKIDPQERLFLQSAYSCIQDAGYTPAALSDSRKIGVFVGVMNGYYPSGARFWSIANRVSYTFNFRGPSVAVDTACASSITAIHFALESLYSGSCQCAIAGGVNLIQSPEHYMKYTELTMLSPGNLCKAFGENADGFVDSEGIGTILLKPLRNAVADGDHIYGVIMASAINAGGKTNGYTVPNPKAQTEMILEALERAGIHSRQISYVEAHGTGTALGDPIEVTGLTNAFEKDTKEKQFCYLGSVKSNIGHCESTAGIAGLTKVLLQLQHKQLVPSINSTVPNPKIDFANTPFKVPQEITQWERTRIGDKEFPRTAAISGFGAGGANSHIIIQEYEMTEKQEAQAQRMNQEVLIILSAKKEKRLEEYVNKLVIQLESGKYLNCNLVSIAYTLQTGREEMDERLGFTVNSIDQLRDKLKKYLAGDRTDILCGRVQRNNDMLMAFQSDEELKEVVVKWLKKKKYNKLLELWVRGLSIDWSILYEDIKPKRISLPAYSFAKEKYWIKLDEEPFQKVQTAESVLHYLLDKNVSTLSGIKYSKVFDEKAFYFKDHVVKGRRVFPAAAFIEIAFAASNLALGKKAYTIKNMNFIQFFNIDGSSKELQITLQKSKENEIKFKAISKKNNQEQLYATGTAVSTNEIFTEEKFNINKLKMKIESGQGVKVYEKKEFYEICRNNEIEYGNSFQGVEFFVGNDSESLTKIVLPEEMIAIKEEFYLHPALLDAAFQAALVQIVVCSESRNTFVPYSIKEVEVYQSIPEKCSAYCIKTNQEGNGIAFFRIFLIDENGNAVIKLDEFAMKEVVNKKLDKAENLDEEQVARLLDKYQKGEIDISYLEEQLW
ncbi:UNVERIFIED_CONTAM: polyketide synthase PksL/polyketide synthase PksN [Acetivibrio alkalicellulosi]